MTRMTPLLQKMDIIQGIPYFAATVSSGRRL